ncbi:MAG: YebC/PmpR family DNA-binding transcriptional regulator [Planctomycetota bacterium]
MAGHSHWANITHKKGANDAKKAAVITKMGKLIKVAVQLGGPDLDTNPRLRLAIAKARAQNMTKDAIERAIKKAAGDAEDGKRMEELVYEGYAAGGVAVVVEAMTDNRNRTAPEIKKLFERAGGSMGAPGCVSWQFNLKAVFLVESDDEDRVLEALLEGDADAEDVAVSDDGQVTVTAAPEAYEAVTEALNAAGIDIVSSDLTKVPDNDSVIDDLELAQKVQRLLDALDEHDDVSAVATNFAPSSEVAAQL